MVKRGGTKKKIAIEKIQKFDSLRVSFTKRRDGLFSKASQLCLLSDAQIAILATPPSSESNVSFYSFGHSSVDVLVSAFISGQRPVPVLEGNNKQMREDVGVCLTRKDLGLGLWWEDESLKRSENPEELKHAVDSMWTLLSDLKKLKTNVNCDRRDHTLQAFVNDDDDDDDDLKKEKSHVALGNGEEPDQTLILQSITSPEVCCIPDDHIIVIDDDDSPASFNKITEEQYQINEICKSLGDTDNNNSLPHGNLDYNQEMDTEQPTTSSAVNCIPDDLPANFNENSEEEDLFREICVTDNNNNNNTLPEGYLDYDQDIDIEQLIDFDTPFDFSFDDCVLENTTHQQLEETSASLLTNSETVDDDQVFSSMLCSYLEGIEDDDDNNLPNIAPL